MTLATEISADPLGRGYAAMTDQQVVDDLNTLYRTRDRASMTGDEVFAATDATQYNALTAANKLLWVAFCGRDIIDPFGTANVAFVTDVFGAPSDTLTALATARVESISRAVEIGIGAVTLKDIKLRGGR